MKPTLMKHILLTLATLFCVALSSAQVLWSVTPAINTKEIDSIVVTYNSATVYSVTKPFAGVVAGTQIQGTRFPLGTKVVSNTNDSILVFDQVANVSIALDSIRFDVNTSLQYGAGDALGFPIPLPAWTREIAQITVVDTAAQIASIKFVFIGGVFTQTEDNAVFGISDADSKLIEAYALVDSATTFNSTNKILYRPFNQTPIYLGTKQTYIQAVCVGTPTFATSKALKFNFIIKQ